MSNPALSELAATRRSQAIAVATLSGVAAIILLISAAGLPTLAASPGTYNIDTKTSMPHLRENLRYSDQRVRRHVEADAIEAYFPILGLATFARCELNPGGSLGSSVMYLLACPGSGGTTGAALVEDMGDRIDGVLSVRMGGKNMTFSQRITARRVEDGASANPTTSQE